MGVKMNEIPVSGNFKVKKLDVGIYSYTASNDQTVKKIDQDGNEVWTFSGHTANVVSIAPDPGLYGAGFW